MSDLEKKEKKPSRNKTGGVLTKEDMKKQGSQKKAPPVASKAEAKQEKEVKKNVDVEFECGFAPAGNSNIAFIHKYQGVDYKYELKLKNKIYILPKDLKEEDVQRYRTALKDNGFMDVTVIKGGAHFSKKKGVFLYSVMHPEHTSRNPINGNIALVLQDDNGRPLIDEKTLKTKSKQVTIINGKVTTDDPLIYEALIRAGFYSAGKKEKEE